MSTIAQNRGALEAIASGNAETNGRVPADAITAATELQKLLALDKIDLEIRGARVVGRGRAASADLYLSDGSTIEFESLRHVGTPKDLMLEVAACTGATPNLKQPQALRAVALLREIAEHHATRTVDQIYVDLGLAYLQSATERRVVIADQHDRWQAFSELERADPFNAARAHGVGVAQASTVLVDAEGTRYVRAGWFQMHARREDPTASPHEIGVRMVRVGWERRGRDGRIKATRPGNAGSLVWPFYVVAAGWEDQW